MGWRFNEIIRHGVQQLQTLAVTGSINSGVGPTFIGKSGSNINHYDGLIDEVRLYNRALSASEIKATEVVSFV